MCLSIYLHVSASEYKLSSYQDTECSLCSESCWHHFDLDVRAIRERVLRFSEAVNESLDQRAGGTKDSNACERNKTTKATHARGEQSTGSCHIDLRKTQPLSALRAWRRCGGEDRGGCRLFSGRSVFQLRRQGRSVCRCNP